MWALGASCYYGVWFAECYIHVSVSKVVCLVVLICRVLCLNCPNIVATIASSSNLRVSKEVSFLCPMSLRSSADPMFLNCWTVLVGKIVSVSIQLVIFNMFCSISGWGIVWKLLLSRFELMRAIFTDTDSRNKSPAPSSRQKQQITTHTAYRKTAYHHQTRDSNR